MSEPGRRLLSLDALRGYTIAAMIVVNTPGSWEAMYPPLQHAAWHGLTPTDLIFPFFLFIVGVSVGLAYANQRVPGGAAPGLHRRILGRSAKIFAVGLFLNLWPDFAFGDLRVAGVLQRIALVFGISALLFLHLRTRTLAFVTGGALLGAWALLTLVPVPRDAVIEQAVESGTVERAWGTRVAVMVRVRDATTIAPNLESGTNLAAWLDRRLLPGRHYERTWDPEGLLSTLPALATSLLGVLTALFLRRFKGLRERLWGLGLAGLALLLAGSLWSLVLPLNKHLWTSSFVLVTAGWALLLLALATGLIDGLGRRRWAWPGLVFGSNAITAYVLAGMLTVVVYRPWVGGVSLAGAWMRTGAALGAPAELASLLFSLAYTAVCFLPVWLLYRKRIFLRL
jgi:predicted acyltransferase